MARHYDIGLREFTAPTERMIRRGLRRTKVADAQHTGGNWAIDKPFSQEEDEEEGRQICRLTGRQTNSGIV